MRHNHFIDLRDEVERALRTSFPSFAESHPRLAAVLDQDLLVDAAMEHFADDPDYQHALADATAAGVAAETLSGLIQALTSRWLRTLL